jgi:putative oxidoreductase
LAALSEFGGGLAWILGLVTPLASLGIASTMAVAAFTHMSGNDPFVNLTGGPSYETAALFFGIAILFMALGPGRFSLDRAIFGPRALHVKSFEYP